MIRPLSLALPAIVAGLLVLAPPPARAQLHSTCAAAKKTCVTKKVKALLACHAAAEKKGVPVDAECIAKAQSRFDGGTNPAKGCFAKIEAKQKPAKPATLCPSVGDTAVLESAIDAFADAVANSLAGLSGETCADAQTAAVGVLAGQSTAGFVDDFAPCGFPGSFDGPDRVYAIVVPPGKTLTASATPIGLDGASLALFRGLANCGATALPNCEDVISAAGTATVQVEGTNSGQAPETFFLLVGSSGTDPVSFNLSLAIP